MHRVRAKKSLGQHFLKDKKIASRISEALSGEGYDSVLEIGPGMGMLTQFIAARNFTDFRVVEIDRDSVSFLRDNITGVTDIIEGDFLRMEITSLFPGKLAIIGNFPYNISTQIMFRVLEARDNVVEVCGMFQREVAERICAAPGSKTYGILSVLLQAFYRTEYLFTVSEKVFSPPPKVKSGVIRLRRNESENLGCDEDLFFKVVKSCFNQRRKMLRNSVKASFNLSSFENPVLNLRPEQLSVEEFVDLTNWIARYRIE